MCLSQGAGQIGTPGSGARFTDTADIQKWIDVMVAHCQLNIDSARVYGNGTSEKVQHLSYAYG